MDAREELPARELAAAGEGLAAAREGLAAAGALLGVTVAVSDDRSWELVRTAGGRAELRVGLGWYAERGHGADEAVALAMLQLWGGGRFGGRAPARARRADSLAAALPGSAPLLAAVTRLQSAAELLTAMPGLRPRLEAAVVRGLPGDLAPLPRHLQWLVLLLRSGAGAGPGAGAGRPAGGETAKVTGAAGAAAEVAREWRELWRRAAAGADPLRRVLAPDPGRDPLERFERALALLLPPYRRLLAIDARERGWGEPGGAGGTDESDPGADGVAAGAAAGEAEAEAQQDDEGGGAGETAPPEDEEDPARPGEGRERAEGADLFAAEQAGFVRAVLDTPLPAEGALLRELAEIDAAAEAGDPAPDEDRESAGGAGAGAALAARQYRDRAARLAEPIERMREVWARVIAERVASVRAPGRRAAPEGEMLDLGSLARAVAEASAGVERPAAYLRRERRDRRTQRAGSTDYVLLVDRSASMRGRAAEAAADAALIMLEAMAGAARDIAHAEQRHRVDLELELRTALVLFDAEARLVKPLSAGLDDAERLEMIAGIRSPRGSTADAAALRLAAAQLGLLGGGGGEGRERRRVVIVVSDGGSDDDAAAAAELRRLRAAGVGVHGIGIASDEVVRRYAPSSRRIDDPERIADAIGELLEGGLP
ncbi:vWA domain-containing protein [Leucobacter massiliensis]|uniref:VWFA domain-containing protein n=1 Tax=Leucobacter massiliensis TaxID=1686285 RepID=A0A2S9QRK1_9MICO|nr:VWA domain-containing protein [Leucobacter massiliensis]PRI12216.1 hypothetical protein B4915_03965 [Leucobacter massiliensis]